MLYTIYIMLNTIIEILSLPFFYNHKSLTIRRLQFAKHSLKSQKK